MDIYDTDQLIKHIVARRIDISPRDRLQWKLFLCSLKVLGYDRDTFAAMSSCPSRDSYKAWDQERRPDRYKTPDQAKAMIVYLAKEAGIDLRPYLKKKTHHIPEINIVKCAEHYRETSLYSYLCHIFPEKDVDRVFERYRIGGSAFINPQGGRAVVFPYLFPSGICRDCKIMNFDPETGSRKTAPPLYRYFDRRSNELRDMRQTWALSVMRKSDGRDEEWTNFGDHLVNEDKECKIGILESEKSAIIASLVYPEIIWVACGSLSNFRLHHLQHYRGRKVVAFPDRDGLREWKRIAAAIPADQMDVSVDTTVSRYPGEPKDDLADIIIRSLMGRQQPPTEEQQPPTTPDRREAEILINSWDLNPVVTDLLCQLDLVPERIIYNSLL